MRRGGARLSMKALFFQFVLLATQDNTLCGHLAPWTWRFYIIIFMAW
jgi:hypothetical protein